MSRTFPRVMSWVSPYTLHLLATCTRMAVWPPETKIARGSRTCPSDIAMSRCATPWWTGNNGFPKYEARARLTVAPIRRQGPSPGPAEYAIASGSNWPPSEERIAFPIMESETAAGGSDAFWGCIQYPAGGLYV